MSKHVTLGNTDGDVFMDGRWHCGDGAPIDIVDPFTERNFATARGASRGQAERALSAARSAFDGGLWPHESPATRSAALHRIADAVDKRRDILVSTFVEEGGCPIALTRALQVDLPVQHLRWFAEVAARGPMGGWQQDLGPDPLGLPVRTLLLREPVGVVLAITPYNIPLLAAVWKVGAALAAGCTAILMPSPRAQLTSRLFAEAFTDADLPPGVFGFLGGDADIGRFLTESDRIDMVSFTGSELVGSRVMAQAAASIKRVLLELGGKSPALVLPGADLARAVPGTILRYTRHAGQACGATTRVLVHESQYDEFVDRARMYIETLKVGDPREETTVIGPLIRDEHRRRVEGFVTRAVEAGAKVIAGGGRPDLPHGFFLRPTLVGDASASSEIAQEELFGPVAVAFRYHDVDDAVALANQTRYGLNSSVWGDPEIALSVVGRLRSGAVSINGAASPRPETPMGGFKRSGNGRESGELGFLEFLESKTVQMPLTSG